MVDTASNQTKLLGEDFKYLLTTMGEQRETVLNCLSYDSALQIKQRKITHEQHVYKV